MDFAYWWSYHGEGLLPKGLPPLGCKIYNFCLPELLGILLNVSLNLNSKRLLFPILLAVFSSLFDCEFDSCGQLCNTSCFQLNLCCTFDPDGQCVQLHSNSQPYIKQGVHKCYFNPIKHIHIPGQLRRQSFN